MAQAAYAYEISPLRRVREVERPPLRALPGRKQDVKKGSLVVHLARTSLVTGACCFVMVVAIGLTSIGLSNATVKTLINTEVVSQSIIEARSVGLTLEVQHSFATNPARIQDEAIALGMGPAVKTATLEATPVLTPEILEAITQASIEDTDEGLDLDDSSAKALGNE